MALAWNATRETALHVLEIRRTCVTLVLAWQHHLPNSIFSRSSEAQTSHQAGGSEWKQ